MPITSRSIVIRTMFVAAVCLTASARAATPVIYDLGTLGSWTTVACGVNDSGQVAGTSYASPFDHAFRYDGTPGSGGTMRDLGTLSGFDSSGRAINNAGQVAGVSYWQPQGANHAFRYDGTPGSGGTMRDLGTLGGVNSFAWGINGSGQVTGYSNMPLAGYSHAFRYDGTPGSGGIMRDLGSLTPGGSGNSSGRAINDSGQVAGTSEVPGSVVHAIRYDGTPGSGGVMRDLGTLGGTSSEGWAINNAGQVAGYSDITSNLARHAVRYDGTPGSGGIMRDLGTLGGTDSGADGINDAGQLVGHSDITANAASHPFFYNGTPGAGGQMIDLEVWLDANNPTEGAKWTLQQALDLSNTGWITGTGIYDPDGAGGIAAGTRAFLLDASALVPEPGTFSVLAIAVAATFLPRRSAGAKRT